MITTVKGHEFDYETVDEAMDGLRKITFDRMFVGSGEISQVRNLLHLQGKKPREMRAVRNAVVDRFCDLRRKQGIVTENGNVTDYDAFDRISTSISAITSVIDCEIFNRGGEP